MTECSKQLELTQAYLNEREEVIDMLKSQKIADDEAWEKRLESEKLELVKQLTIDNELDMEELRKQFQAAINEKESDVLQLRSELKGNVFSTYFQQSSILLVLFRKRCCGYAFAQRTRSTSV